VRADSEDLEELTQTARLRSQRLSDALAETMAAGSAASVFCGKTEVTGMFSMVVNDLAVLDTGPTEASVHLRGPIAISIAERTQGGTGGSQAVRSFVARLREFELTSEPVDIVGSFGVVSGSIEVVADGYVRVRDDAKTWLLLLTEIGIVLRPTPPSPSLG
jgi:hypothetical protein